MEPCRNRISPSVRGHHQADLRVVGPGMGRRTGPPRKPANRAPKTMSAGSAKRVRRRDAGRPRGATDVGAHHGLQAIVAVVRDSSVHANAGIDRDAAPSAVGVRGLHERGGGIRFALIDQPVQAILASALNDYPGNSFDQQSGCGSTDPPLAPVTATTVLVRFGVSAGLTVPPAVVANLGQAFACALARAGFVC